MKTLSISVGSVAEIEIETISATKGYVVDCFNLVWNINYFYQKKAVVSLTNEYGVTLGGVADFEDMSLIVVSNGAVLHELDNEGEVSRYYIFNSEKGWM